MATTLKGALAQLEALGNEKLRAQNRRKGAGDNQFGAQLATSENWPRGLRRTKLWPLLCGKPGTSMPGFSNTSDQSKEPVRRRIRSDGAIRRICASGGLAQLLRRQDIPNKETLRQRWMADDDPWTARAGWSLTSERIGKNPEGLDLPALRADRVRNGGCCSRSTMDDELLSCRIGIHFPKSQARYRHRRNFGNLSRLPRFQGLHLSLRPDLDQGNGESAGVNHRMLLTGLVFNLERRL